MIINEWNDPNKGGQELFSSVMDGRKPQFTLTLRYCTFFSVSETTEGSAMKTRTAFRMNTGCGKIRCVANRNENKNVQFNGTINLQSVGINT